MSELSTARSRVHAVAEARPALMGGFSQMHGAALDPGALDVRAKETIAVALSVALDCDGCVAWHVDAAKRAGATQDELVDAVGLVVLFAGGPGVQRVGAAMEEIATAFQNVDTSASGE